MTSAGLIKLETSSDARLRNPARSSVPRDIVLLRVILILIAPVFALLTWQVDYGFTQMRHFSVPVLAGEIAIILIAVSSRFDFSGALAALHPITRWAAVIWFAVSAWASLVVAIGGLGSNILFMTSCVHGVFGLVMWWKLKTDWHEHSFKILDALALGMSLYVLIILMLALSQAGNPDFDWKLFSPGVSHDRQLAFYGLTLSGIAAGFVAFARGTKCTAIWSGLLAIGCWLTIWSGGRAGFGAMLGALVVIGMMIPAQRRWRFAGIAAASVLIAIALSYAFVPSERHGFDSVLFRSASAAGGLEGFTTGRTRMWSEALADIAQRPFFGHGEGQFRWVAASALKHFNHPHSAPLQLLFQWGFVGTLAVLGMLAVTMQSSLRSIRHLPRQAIIAAGPLAGLVAMSLIDGAAYYVLPVMVMVLSIAVIAASLGEPPADRSAPAK